MPVYEVDATEKLHVRYRVEAESASDARAWVRDGAAGEPVHAEVVGEPVIVRVGQIVET